MVAMDEWETDGCCTLGDGHDGACVWDCSACYGRGTCWLCKGTSGGDDVTWCEGCDGTGYCATCHGDGYVVQDIGSLSNGV